MKAEIRALLLSAELLIFPAILGISCASASVLGAPEVRATVLGRERVAPQGMDGPRFYVTVEFRDTGDVLRHERVEVTWREWALYEDRTPCVYEIGYRIELRPCRVL